jgi:hypothetical protein
MIMDRKRLNLLRVCTCVPDSGHTLLVTLIVPPRVMLAQIVDPDLRERYIARYGPPAADGTLPPPN